MSTKYLLFCILIAIALCHVSDGLDLTKFLNFKGTERHDSYLSFKNASTSISFPMELKWSRNDTGCYAYNPFMELVFDGNSIYCIANENEGPLFRNINSSILSITISDGSTNWYSYLYNSTIPGNVNTSFTGPVALSSQVLSVLDNNYGNLFLLNSTNGNILQNVSIKSPCPPNENNGYYCIQSGITSSPLWNSSFIFYTESVDNKGIGTLMSLDVNGKTSMVTANGYVHSVAQMPTICKNDVVVTTNLFDKVDAFDIRNNFEHLWGYNVSKSDEYGTVMDLPAVCIPTVDGYFNVLVPSIEVNVVQQRWHLLDGRTGRLRKEITFDSHGLPAIHIDKMMLIRNGGHDLTAYNLSSDINGNWTTLWSTDLKYEYEGMLIIDDYILMANTTAFNVYNIDNGKFVWSYTFPNGNGPFIESKIIVGLTLDKKPVVIVLALHELTNPIQSTMFVLS